MPNAVRIALIALLGLFAVAIAVRCRPPILGDDAAITLRYADRIAHGHGFTYNDGERIDGASNPLWTLVVAGIELASGGDAERAARIAVAAASGAATVAAVLAGEAIAGLVPALMLGLLLSIDHTWTGQAFSGLEVPLSLTLGLAAITAIARGRDRLAGICLGLALWNKLDAALLVGPALGLVWIARRRFPREFVVAAAIAAAPWFLFATAYFGSPLPHSLTTKLHDGATNAISPAWIWNVVVGTEHEVALALGVAGLAWLAIRRDARWLPAAIVMAWLTAHVVAYSTISLGAPYPWYFGVPIALTVVGAAACTARVRWWIGALIVSPLFVVIPLRARPAADVASYEAFDADRLLAGAFVDQFAATSEGVTSGFGWVAFECRRRFVDATLLNSDRIVNLDYLVLHGTEPAGRDGTEPMAPPDHLPLATFDMAHRRNPKQTWFIVFGRPDSAIARAGRTDRDVDVSRLRDPRLIAAWRATHPDRGPAR